MLIRVGPARKIEPGTWWIARDTRCDVISRVQLDGVDIGPDRNHFDRGYLRIFNHRLKINLNLSVGHVYRVSKIVRAVFAPRCQKDIQLAFHLRAVYPDVEDPFIWRIEIDFGESKRDRVRAIRNGEGVTHSPRTVPFILIEPLHQRAADLVGSGGLVPSAIAVVC